MLNCSFGDTARADHLNHVSLQYWTQYNPCFPSNSQSGVGCQSTLILQEGLSFRCDFDQVTCWKSETDYSMVTYTPCSYKAKIFDVMIAAKPAAAVRLDSRI